MGRISLVVCDLVLSFMWIWAGVLVNILVHGVLGFSRKDTTGDIVRYLFSVISMFLFAFLQKLTKGGLYNPLTALASGVSGGFRGFIFSVLVRIPVEVCFVDFFFLESILFLTGDCVLISVLMFHKDFNLEIFCYMFCTLCCVVNLIATESFCVAVRMSK